LYDAGDEALWSKESIAGMEELTHGQVLQAQVCGYAEDGLPMVYLYAIHGSQVRVTYKEPIVLFCNPMLVIFNVKERFKILWKYSWSAMILNLKCHLQ
jgi:hypothetical protein